MNNLSLSMGIILLGLSIVLDMCSKRDLILSRVMSSLGLLILSANALYYSDNKIVMWAIPILFLVSIVMLIFSIQKNKEIRELLNETKELENEIKQHKEIAAKGKILEKKHEERMLEIRREREKEMGEKL